MNKLFTLFLIIFLEGYIVLSVELLAIRQTLPFVGSGTDTVSIIIAAVLMPLAFGYYSGGRFRPVRWPGGKYLTLRGKLMLNLLVAGSVLAFGLSYYVLDSFFHALISEFGWRDRLAVTSVYALLFVVIPVYLLGQTVPLVSNYFTKAKLSRAAGAILFFSTVGSFFGAVFSTLFLMNTIGVNYTVVVSMAMIAFLVALLSKRLVSVPVVIGLLVLGVSWNLNSAARMAEKDIVFTNVYNNVQIKEAGNERVRIRHIMLNGINSSTIDVNDPARPVFPYTRNIHERFIRPFQRHDRKGDILVIGAGGFVTGQGDRWNNYTFVDIDPDLKEVAETYFLKRKLTENKKFVPEPARAFLSRSDAKFDLIIMDAFRGLTGAPEHLVTREFFRQIRDHLKEDGVVVISMFSSAMFGDEFTRTVDDTIRSVFPYINRQINKDFDGWDAENGDYYVMLYYGRYRAGDLTRPRRIYTDNLNPSIRDKSTGLPE